MEKIKQIHLQIHLYLGNQSPKSAVNEIIPDLTERLPPGQPEIFQEVFNLIILR